MYFSGSVLEYKDRRMISGGYRCKCPVGMKETVYIFGGGPARGQGKVTGDNLFIFAKFECFGARNLEIGSVEINELFQSRMSSGHRPIFGGKAVGNRQVFWRRFSSGIEAP